MNIISNTSPLTNLAAIRQFNLLHQLYHEVHIAEAVWTELNARGQRWPGSDEVAAAHWIQRHAVQDQRLVVALQRDLDRGEAESIVLALERKADLILLDEREGRHIAQRLGLRVVGTVGILLAAKAQGHVKSVKPHLDALRQSAGFYLSESLYQSALAQSGEKGMG